jgi:hypothetical protein
VLRVSVTRSSSRSEAPPRCLAPANCLPLMNLIFSGETRTTRRDGYRRCHDKDSYSSEFLRTNSEAFLKKLTPQSAAAVSCRCSDTRTRNLDCRNARDRNDNFDETRITREDGFKILPQLSNRIFVFTRDRIYRKIRTRSTFCNDKFPDLWNNFLVRILSRFLSDSPASFFFLVPFIT